MHFDREEGIILSLDEGSATSTGGGAYLKQWNGASSCRAVCVYYNYVGVAHFAHAHKNLRVMWHGLCALNLDVAIDIGWEASGVILDCCRRTTGVSCTKVLHLFNEAQIFDNLFVAHTIIEPLYDRRHHQSKTTHF